MSSIKVLWLIHELSRIMTGNELDKLMSKVRGWEREYIWARVQEIVPTSLTLSSSEHEHWDYLLSEVRNSPKCCLSVGGKPCIRYMGHSGECRTESNE